MISTIFWINLFFFSTTLFCYKVLDDENWCSIPKLLQNFFKIMIFIFSIIWIIFKGYFSTIFDLDKTRKPRVIACHMSRVSTVQVPFVSSSLIRTEKISSFRYRKLFGSLYISNDSFWNSNTFDCIICISLN